MFIVMYSQVWTCFHILSVFISHFHMKWTDWEMFHFINACEQMKWFQFWFVSPMCDSFAFLALITRIKQEDLFCICRCEFCFSEICYEIVYWMWYVMNMDGFNMAVVFIHLLLYNITSNHHLIPSVPKLYFCKCWFYGFATHMKKYCGKL